MQVKTQRTPSSLAPGLGGFSFSLPLLESFSYQDA